MINIIIWILSIGLSIANVLIFDRLHNWYDIWKIAVGVIVIYIALMLIYWLISYIISLTVNTKKDYEHYNKFYGRYFGLMMGYACSLGGARIKVTGLEKLPKEKFLFVSNHISTFDTMVQTSVLWKYNLAFISKPENFKIPIGHRFMTRCRYMALDRSDIREGVRITRKAANMIQSDDTSVGVYPEGTRNKTTEPLIEFKDGCFKTALWAKCPIVIGSVQGTNKIHLNFLRRFTPVRFDIVRVLTYDEIKDMKTHDISEIVREEILRSIS